MAQIMRNLSTMTKKRLATSASMAPATSAPDSGVKKRGRKTNAEKAAAAQSEEAAVTQDKEQTETQGTEPPPKRKYTRRKKVGEEAEKPPESPTKKRKIASDNEDDASLTGKEGPSTVVEPPAAVSKRVTRKSAKRDPVLELRGLLQKCTHSRALIQASEFVSWAPAELKIPEIIEAFFGFITKLSSKNCWSLLNSNEGKAVISIEEENLIRLCNELSEEKSWKNLKNELFDYIAKKQLSTIEKMTVAEVNRNYRILFTLIEDINVTGEVSEIEKAYQDSLLDNLILNRSPEAIITTICYLLTICPSSIKKFIVRRVIEDDFGYSDLLNAVVNEYPKEKEILGRLVTERAEIDFENCKLNKSLTLEDYSSLMYSKMGDIYFAEKGLNGFDMDGEMIYSISPNIQKMSSLVAALFSHEVFKDFKRTEFLEEAVVFVKNIIQSILSRKKEFNGLCVFSFQNITVIFQIHSTIRLMKDITIRMLILLIQKTLGAWFKCCML